MPRVKFDNLGRIGVVRDIPEQELPPEAFSDAINVRFTTTGVESVLGERQVMGTALVDPRWMVQLPPAENPYWVYGDNSKLCVYDGSTHSDITRVAQPYSGDSTQRWSSTMLNGLLIVNNTVDIPQVWTSFNPTTAMIDLANWPSTLRCKSLRAHKNFLFALHLSELGTTYPFRIRWSHPAQPGTVPISWTTNDPKYDSRQFDLGDTEDHIVDGISAGDVFIVYRERSAYGMQFVGGSNKFRNWRLLDEAGLLWRDCAQATPRGIVALGQDDIYFHNTQRNSNESIIHDRMRKWLFSIISPSNYYNSYTVKNPAENEVWFCVPEAGATFATLAVMWNWKTGNIGFRELDEVPYMAAGVVANNDDDSGVWGE